MKQAKRKLEAGCRGVDLEEAELEAAADHFADMLFVKRLRTDADRQAVRELWQEVWRRPLRDQGRPSFRVSHDAVLIGRACLSRCAGALPPPPLLPAPANKHPPPRFSTSWFPTSDHGTFYSKAWWTSDFFSLAFCLLTVFPKSVMYAKSHKVPCRMVSQHVGRLSCFSVMHPILPCSPAPPPLAFKLHLS